MRITGPSGPTAPGSKSGTRRVSNGTFSLPEPENTPHSAATAATRSLAGIDALLALQGVEDPTERRRRAVKRGNSALDALDELKLALLGGKLDTHVIGRLRAAVAALKESTGDPALDGVLAEIELRAEVELAKVTYPTER